MNKPLKITEAIVLAGGLGTRLRNVIGEFPKPLAPINGIPFLEILFDYLKAKGINSIVLSVGYKYELIQERFGANYKGISIQYAIENKRLGTGGGIRLALEKIKGENTFVLNGDTFFSISLNKLATFHIEQNSICTLALKKIKNSDRYGTIEINSLNQITAFKEKEFQKKALINGGVYCLSKNALAQFELNLNFSFETDYLAKGILNTPFLGIEFDTYFKDIGIPEDYTQFENDHKNNQLN